MVTHLSSQWRIVLVFLPLTTGLALVKTSVTNGVSLSASGHASMLEQQTPRTMHFIYTVGCNEYQVIQSVALDHSWKEVGNLGKLTRIVGGCTNKTQQEFLKTSPLSGDPNFAVFFADGDLATTPNTGKTYPARARPHSITMWLEKHPPPTDDVVVILDPDMVWMRPLSEHPSLAKVRPGLMLAQRYAQAKTWIQFAQAGESTPPVSDSDAINVYATGPPWVVDTSDLQRMLPEWRRYTDAQKGGALMREQNAFNMAALKHGIPSMGSTDLMVSYPGGYGEAWDSPGPGDLWSPYVLHYCQGYKFKSWEFQKALLSDGWYAESFANSVPTPITCGAPLLEEPPPVPTKAEEPDVKARQNAFMISMLISRMSRAFKDTRAKYCGAENHDLLGFMRTMQPVHCKPGHAPQTHYLVEKASGTWESVLPRGKDKCSKDAQML